MTGYAVEWATSENGPWSTATADTGSTTTSYTHTGRTPQTSYHYRVGAINDSGTGERSDSASATTPAAPVVTITVGPIGNPTTSIGEDAVSLTFVLSRDGDTSERLQVKQRVTLKGEFLSALQIFGQTDIEAGAANKNLTWLPTNDNVDEPDGSVTVELLPRSRLHAGHRNLGDRHNPRRRRTAWSADAHSHTGQRTGRARLDRAERHRLGDDHGVRVPGEQRWGHDVGSGLDRDREQRTRRD